MSPSGLGGNLTDCDRRASPVEEGAPVRELIQLSVLGEPMVNSLQEPMPAEKRLEYAIQATAVIWQPVEQMRYVVSDDVDSFGMAPWDLTAPESEIETSDSDSDRLDPHTDSSAVIMPSGGRSDETYGGFSLAPAIVSGRDVLMEDGAVAVDTRQVSAASDSIVSRKIQRESEYVPTIVPTVVVAPQTAAEVVQPKPRDYCYTDSLPPVSECLDSPSMDNPDSGESGMEMAGGNPPADIDVVPDVLPTAISVKTVVSDKSEMAGDDPAEESLDVGSDVCVGTDSMPTAVSVRTVVTEEWMDRFVMNPVECPSVSSTSAVARTFGPAVSEEYSPVFFAGGGGGRLLIHTPWLSLCQIQREYLSCLLPVVSSRPFFWGKVAFDVGGLGVGPPCLRVDSEETLLTVIDERAQLRRGRQSGN